MNQTEDPRKRNKNLETGENCLLLHPTNRKKKPHLYPEKDKKNTTPFTSKVPAKPKERKKFIYRQKLPQTTRETLLQ
jgi:hypothetical protein